MLKIAFSCDSIHLRRLWMMHAYWFTIFSSQEHVRTFGTDRRSHIEYRDFLLKCGSHNNPLELVKCVCWSLNPARLICSLANGSSTGSTVKSTFNKPAPASRWIIRRHFCISFAFIVLFKKWTRTFSRLFPSCSSHRVFRISLNSAANLLNVLRSVRDVWRYAFTPVLL